MTDGTSAILLRQPSTAFSIYNPEGLSQPLGQYSHITRVRAKEFIFLAGMLSADAEGKSVGIGNFDEQLDQIFHNVRTALASAGATLKNVVQFTTYLTSPDLIPALMKYRLAKFPELFGGSAYPPNTLLIVNRLVHEEFLVEVQAIAALTE